MLYKINNITDKIKSLIRTKWVNLAFNKSFYRIGKDYLIRNPDRIKIGRSACIMNRFWIEAVSRYNDENYKPTIIIGNNFRASNDVHIAAIDRIEIGDNCLIGSNVTIIDHNHGNYRDDYQNTIKIEPSKRKLHSTGKITIGNNCWIGDNVVILAGAAIGDNCTIGAGSIIKTKIKNNCIGYNKRENVAICK